MYRFITFYVILDKTVYTGHACENNKNKILGICLTNSQNV